MVANQVKKLAPDSDPPKEILNNMEYKYIKHKHTCLPVRLPCSGARLKEQRRPPGTCDLLGGRARGREVLRRAFVGNVEKLGVAKEGGVGQYKR